MNTAIGRKGNSNTFAARCPSGGIGRRARLKLVFRKKWGFDSLLGHLTVKNRKLYLQSDLKNQLFFKHFAGVVQLPESIRDEVRAPPCR